MASLQAVIGCDKGLAGTGMAHFAGIQQGGRLGGNAHHDALFSQVFAKELSVAQAVLQSQGLAISTEQGLGKDFTPAVKQAWSDAYGLLSGVMIAAAEQVESRSAA